MFEITMFHYLFLGLLVFLIGLVGSILSRNIIKIWLRLINLKINLKKN